MAAYQYAFKKASRIRADATKAAKLFKKLEQGKGLTPKNLVAVSRPKNALLHNEFEWDDSKAAEKYRENQAYRIINALVIVHPETEEQMRECFPIKVISDDSEKPRNEYHTLEVIATNAEWQDQVMERAKKELDAFAQKYKMLNSVEEFIPVFKAIEALKSTEDLVKTG